MSKQNEYDQVSLALLENNRSQQQQEVLERFLMGVKFFKEIISQCGPSIMKKLSPKIQGKIFQQDEIIVRSGDSGDAFYVIISGKVGVWIVLTNESEESGDLKELKTLSVYDTFGEMALLSDRNVRTATIITKDTTLLAMLTKDDFVGTIGTKYVEQLNNKIYFLSQLDLFKGWNIREIKTLSYQFQNIETSYRQKIYTTESQCDYCYFVQNGQFKLSRIIQDEHTQTEFDLCVFDSNQIFGLESVLRLGKYYGTIECVSKEGMLYRIHHHDLAMRLHSEETRSIINGMANLQVSFLEDRVQNLHFVKYRHCVNRRFSMSDPRSFLNQYIKQRSQSQENVRQDRLNFHLAEEQIKDEEWESKYVKRNFAEWHPTSRVYTQPATQRKVRSQTQMSVTLRSKDAPVVDSNAIQFSLRERLIAQDNFEKMLKTNRNEHLQKDVYGYQKTDLRAINKIVHSMKDSRKKRIPSSSIEKSKVASSINYKQMRIILVREQTMMKALHRQKSTDKQSQLMTNDSYSVRRSPSRRKMSENESITLKRTMSRQFIQSSRVNLNMRTTAIPPFKI